MDEAVGREQTLYHIASRKTGETMMTAPLAEQLAVILHDPLGYARILAASVVGVRRYALQIVRPLRLERHPAAARGLSARGGDAGGGRARRIGRALRHGAAPVVAGRGCRRRPDDRDGHVSRGTHSARIMSKGHRALFPARPAAGDARPLARATDARRMDVVRGRCGAFSC